MSYIGWPNRCLCVRWVKGFKIGGANIGNVSDYRYLCFEFKKNKLNTILPYYQSDHDKNATNALIAFIRAFVANHI
jgi:hypothetical protein